MTLLFLTFFKKRDHLKLVRAILGVFQRYFSEIDSPFNLAILRIVLFSIALFDPTTPEAEWFAGLPKALLHPPLGMEWLMSYIPLDPGFAHGAVLLLKVLCFFGLIGFFSRTSSLAAALCGIYVWGLPQLYGKVFHEFHILVWLMLLLALAPCAEVLSLDAVLKAFRAADRGRLPSNAPALKFGLPLRFTWLLMGVCYFYPGMWKAAAGPVWIFSNNLKYHL